MRRDQDPDRSFESGRFFAPLGMVMAGVLSALVAASCGSVSEKPSGGGGGTGSLDGGSPDTPALPPFQAAQPYTYVAKVKNLLVGLPPTDDFWSAPPQPWTSSCLCGPGSYPGAAPCVLT